MYSQITTIQYGVLASLISIPGEYPMAYEGILSRVGRLVAGLAHATVDKAEQSDPLAVVEQAIREIEAEAGRTRAQLATKTAEHFRISTRTDEIDRERLTLDEQIASALASGREDLAKVGVERQMDLEAQSSSLRAALDVTNEEIADARNAINAIVAARREAEARLTELRRSQSSASRTLVGQNGEAPIFEDRTARSLEAIARVTGVPAGSTGDAQLSELESLHRQKSVDQRLSFFKERLARG
jgi:phage shock protein A